MADDIDRDAEGAERAGHERLDRQQREPDGRRQESQPREVSRLRRSGFGSREAPSRSPKATTPIKEHRHVHVRQERNRPEARAPEFGAAATGRAEGRG